MRRPFLRRCGRCRSCAAPMLLGGVLPGLLLVGALRPAAEAYRPEVREMSMQQEATEGGEEATTGGSDIDLGDLMGGEEPIDGQGFSDVTVNITLNVTINLPGEEDGTPCPNSTAPTEEPPTPAPPSEPTTAAPTSLAPTSEPATTAAETTQTPTAEPVTSGAPTTAAPSTASPTEPPTTAAPTEPPSTASPTEPPTTATPTRPPATTEPLVTEPPTPAPAPTIAPPVTSPSTGAPSTAAPTVAPSTPALTTAALTTAAPSTVTATATTETSADFCSPENDGGDGQRFDEYCACDQLPWLGLCKQVCAAPVRTCACVNQMNATFCDSCKSVQESQSGVQSEDVDWGTCGPCENWCACERGDGCACLIDQEAGFCARCTHSNFEPGECQECRDFCADDCTSDPSSCECYIQRDAKFCLQCPSFGGQSCGLCDGACACLAEPASCGCRNHQDTNFCRGTGSPPQLPAGCTDYCTGACLWQPTSCQCMLDSDPYFLENSLAHHDWEDTCAACITTCDHVCLQDADSCACQIRRQPDFCVQCTSQALHKGDHVQALRSDGRWHGAKIDLFFEDNNSVLLMWDNGDESERKKLRSYVQAGNESSCGTCAAYCATSCGQDLYSCDCYMQRDPTFCASCPSKGGQPCNTCTGYCREYLETLVEGIQARLLAGEVSAQHVKTLEHIIDNR